MTVREWLAENHREKKFYKVRRRIIENQQFARMHCVPDSTVLDMDVKQYFDDANYPLEAKKGGE